MNQSSQLRRAMNIYFNEGVGALITYLWEEVIEPRGLQENTAFRRALYNRVKKDTREKML